MTLSPPPPVPAKKPLPPPPPVYGLMGEGSANTIGGPRARRFWGIIPICRVFVTSGAVVALIAFAASVRFFGGSHSGDTDRKNRAAQKESDTGGEAENSRKPLGFSPSEKNLSAVELYGRVSPAVVILTAKDDLGRPVGRGSAFFVPTVSDAVGRCRQVLELIHPGCWCGNVVTNFHVIEAAASCDVTLADGRVGGVSSVVTEDETADLAILYVSGDSGQPVATLALDEGPEASVGQRVYAMGNPEGLTNTLSEGIISGRREIDSGVPWLQTTAAISPGSSGGPLLSPSGRVIGVVTASHVDGQNLNFAVPASAVRRLLKAPAKTREIWRGASIFREECDAYDTKLPLWVAIGSGGAVEDKGTQAAKIKAVAPLLTGRKLVQDEKYEGAIRVLAAVPPSFPKEWEYLRLFTLGKAHVRLLRQECSVDAESLTLERARDLRITRQNSPHLASAIRALRTSIELSPEFSPAHEQLCDCLAFVDHWVEALVVAQSLVRLVPRCHAAYTMRGRCFSGAGSRDSALNDYQASLALNPNDGEAYVSMGHEYLVKESRKAIEAYERAIELDFMPSHCHYRIGLAHQSLHEYDKAIAAFKKAGTLQGNPDLYKDEIATCEFLMRQ